MAYLEYGKIDAKTEERMRRIFNKSFKSYWRKKRTFDIIVTSLLMLILFIPMMLIDRKSVV